MEWLVSLLGIGMDSMSRMYWRMAACVSEEMSVSVRKMERRAGMEREQKLENDVMEVKSDSESAWEAGDGGENGESVSWHE
mmetsp:Transcript_1644/g.2928  ORF Transcript_1644/g.2928 Transcript_1644/m.2928 type:complete len:81 (-) Transcript_1644:183-425(-)